MNHSSPSIRRPLPSFPSATISLLLQVIKLFKAELAKVDVDAAVVGKDLLGRLEELLAECLVTTFESQLIRQFQKTENKKAGVAKYMGIHAHVPTTSVSKLIWAHAQALVA